MKNKNNNHFKIICINNKIKYFQKFSSKIKIK